MRSPFESDARFHYVGTPAQFQPIVAVRKVTCVERRRIEVFHFAEPHGRNLARKLFRLEEAPKRFSHGRHALRQRREVRALFRREDICGFRVIERRLYT